MEVEKSIDPKLWHGCAGSIVRIPPLNSTVFYFPQGHAEHSLGSVNFPSSTPIAPLILCRVTSLKFLTDFETDEVYAKIGLVPIPANEIDFEDNNSGLNSVGSVGESEKPASFAKTLTQSDANNGGGFSVPRYCAETIFPRLDYTADPPVQTVVAKDVHGDIWKFRHIYRGTPRRHLLTTGWSTFVNQKKLVAGDSIVFLRAQNGDLCVGIRRAKKGIGGGNDSPSSGWNSNHGSCVTVNPFGGFSCFSREKENRMVGNGNMNLNSCRSFSSSENLRGNGGKVKPEMVLEAVALAASGKPFDVVYYPRASTPEFCVKASAVRAAMKVHWHCGMRFKMAFETEDSSRISWFLGTVSSVQIADPMRWPNSPWRLLQVTWDEPDLLQNMKLVSPWLVELLSNMPVIHLSPFSPPRKKLRLSQQLDYSLYSQFTMPSFSGNPLGPSSPLCCLSDRTPAGIQGARHAQFGISSSDFHPNNKLQSGLCLSSFQQFTPNSRVSDGILTSHRNSSENLSCLLTLGTSGKNSEKSENVKKHQFLLFGQPILTEQQISHSCSSDVVSQALWKSSSDRNSCRVRASSDGSGFTHEQQISQEKSFSSECFWNQRSQVTEPGLDTGHCKVFLKSEDVGRTLDLTVLRSYEELYRRLASMFGIERSDMLSHMLYQDASGAVNRTGDEPFSDFIRSAKRLTILLGSGSDSVGRTRITGMRSRLDASSKTGPLSIFA